MKAPTILAIVALAGFVLVSCNEKSASPSNSASAAGSASEVRTVHLQVTGMT